METEIQLAGTVVGDVGPDSHDPAHIDSVAEGIVEPLGFVRVVTVPSREPRAHHGGWLTMVAEGGRAVYGSYDRSDAGIEATIEGGVGSFEGTEGWILATETTTGERTRYSISGALHQRTHRPTTDRQPRSGTVGGNGPDGPKARREERT